jgi:hypothetical protein
MRIGEGKGTGGRIWNLFHQIHQYIKLANSVIMLGVTSNRQTGINCPNLAIGGCIDAANKQNKPFVHGYEAYSTFATLRLVRWRYKPRSLAIRTGGEQHYGSSTALLYFIRTV